MAFDANFQALTNTHLAPKVMDTILNGNVLALRILGNPKKWSGRQLEKSIKFQKQSNGQSFAGMDTFNTNKSDTKRKLAFDPKGYTIPVVIEGMERDVNAVTMERAAELVAEAMESAADDGVDDIGTMMYADGTGNGGKDIDGLAKIIDDGSVSASYGGLSRSTYTTLQSTVVNVTGNLTSIVPIRTAETGAKHGQDKVSMHVTSETKFNEFEALIQPTMVTNVDTQSYKQVTRDSIVPSKEGLKGEAGFDALFYRGAPVVADEKCPDLRWYMINEKYLNWYGLKSSNTKYKQVMIGGNKDIEGMYENVQSKNLGFHFTGLMDSINQYAEVGHFLLLGQLASFNPNRHAVIKFTT